MNNKMNIHKSGILPQVPIRYLSHNAKPTNKIVRKILFPAFKIKAEVKKVGKKLALDYQDKQPLFIGALSGSFIFLGDLVRQVSPAPDGLNIDFIRASSYGSSMDSSGNVDICNHFKISVKNRNVILVEDIVDTGLTVKKLKEYLLNNGAKSVKICTLLSKMARRTF